MRDRWCSHGGMGTGRNGCFPVLRSGDRSRVVDSPVDRLSVRVGSFPSPLFHREWSVGRW